MLYTHLQPKDALVLVDMILNIRCHLNLPLYFLLIITEVKLSLYTFV